MCKICMWLDLLWSGSGCWCQSNGAVQLLHATIGKNTENERAYT